MTRGRCTHGTDDISDEPQRLTSAAPMRGARRQTRAHVRSAFDVCGPVCGAPGVKRCGGSGGSGTAGDGVVRCGGAGSELGQGREGEADGAATTLASFGEHRAAVRLDDVAHDGQPQAGARLAARGDRSVEPIEDVRQIVSGDARPAVADRETAGVHLDLDHAGRTGCGGAELGRVVDEVQHRSIDRRGSARHHRGVADDR